jgi:2-amino-4-hydroxy-6-hydroxymethyldihydropteridine diphosphokinase
VKPAARQYILALGSNLGDRSHHLAEGIRKLGQSEGCRVTAISNAYDTDPVGFKEQGNFLNICLSLVSELEPLALLSLALTIEASQGRVRGIQDGPRTLDIDLLFYEGGEVHRPELTLPHPRWKGRGFVVIPLRNLLQSPILANDPIWNWLRDEVATLPMDGSGLRPWQGPTPWNHPTP